MKKIIFTFVCILTFLLTGCEVGNNTPDEPNVNEVIITEKVFNEYTSFYFKNPRPELFPRIMIYASQNNLLLPINPDTGEAEMNYALLGFFAQILKDNPIKTSVWFDEVRTQIQPNEVQYASYMLLYANTPQSIVKLRNILTDESREQAESLINNPPNILKDEIEAPTDIDLHWGAYVATGDFTYIERIVAMLPDSQLEVDEDNKEEGYKKYVGLAAHWSLKRNAQRDEYLYNWLSERSLNHENEQIQEILQKMILEIIEGDNSLEGVEINYQ